MPLAHVDELQLASSGIEEGAEAVFHGTHGDNIVCVWIQGDRRRCADGPLHCTAARDSDQGCAVGVSPEEDAKGCLFLPGKVSQIL